MEEPNQDGSLPFLDTQVSPGQPRTSTTMDPTTTQTAGTFPEVVPYIHELGEKFKKTCKNKGIHVHFKGMNAVKTLLMAPKGKDHKLQKSGVFYKFKCPHINCPEEYIGESG